MREKLYATMWDDVGIIRDKGSLERAAVVLEDLEAELDGIGIHGGAGEDDLAYNLTWHDWMNLKNLILVSRAITAAAEAREDSTGAHYRADFPGAGEPETAAFTRVSLKNGTLETTTRPVEFTHVRPGQTLLNEA